MMKRLGLTIAALVALLTSVGCGGEGGPGDTLGPDEDFASLLGESEAAATARGTNVVAVGAGNIEALFNPNNPDLAEATFSFVAGFQKDGAPRGNFVLKRVYPGSGVRGVKSTEITFVDVGEDDLGPYVTMEGIADLDATWTTKHPSGQSFTLQAWDVADGADLLWFEIRRPSPVEAVRGALTLVEPSELDFGKIIIR